MVIKQKLRTPIVFDCVEQILRKSLKEFIVDFGEIFGFVKVFTFDHLKTFLYRCYENVFGFQINVLNHTYSAHIDSWVYDMLSLFYREKIETNTTQKFHHNSALLIFSHNDHICKK